jgi:Ca2+-binding RTX toxin-like protein
MLVDFSGLSGGGILGDVNWNSDIDTMRYAGDLVQTGTDAALAGKDMVTGTVAEDFLNGSIGEDTLIGLAGNDILNGGADADEFVFSDGSGDDLIVDFDISSGDFLNINAFGFADFDAVLAASADVGSDAVIQLDSDDSVTLIGVNTSDLTIGDFLLLP